MKETTIKTLLLHYEVRGRRREEEARGFLAAQLQRPCAVGVSWGKDSIVCAFLCATLLTPQDWLFHVSAGEYEFPTTNDVRDDYLARFPCNYLELPSGDYFDAMRACGLTDVTSSRSAKEDKGKKHMAFKQGVIGARCRVWGLRADESSARRKYARSHGRVSLHKGESLLVMSPIIWWSWLDVWSVIVANHLPYVEVYDKYDEQGEGLAHARSGTWAGTLGARTGRLAFLKRFYPELYQRLVREFPIASTHT